MASCPQCGHKPIKKNRQGLRSCPRHGHITGPRSQPTPQGPSA